MPEPSCVRAGWSSMRWKRSNRRGSSASDTPAPVSATSSTASSPARASRTRTEPASVNLNALDSRFRTTFSHISRSTNTGSPSGSQSTRKSSPPRSIVDSKVLHRSRVSAARSTGSYAACTRPASMRAKSSSEFTSLSSRPALRLAISSDARCAGGKSADASASSIGPTISVIGVRNSWLTLEKNSVLARSISASASARRRSCS